jgi:hypothetical protein
LKFEKTTKWKIERKKINQRKRERQQWKQIAKKRNLGESEIRWIKVKLNLLVSPTKSSSSECVLDSDDDIVVKSNLRLRGKHRRPKRVEPTTTASLKAETAFIDDENMSRSDLKSQQTFWRNRSNKKTKSE